MSAHYTMQEMPDMAGEGKTRLYPKIIIRNCCVGEEFAEEMAQGSTFSPGEIQGMFLSLYKSLARVMASGRSVKIEGLGTFTPALALRKGKEEEAADGSGTKRNAASIKVGNIIFRPDKCLVSETNRHCHLVRSPHKFHLKHSKYTPQERLVIAQRYLDTHPTLTLATYASLTGLGRTKAGEELRQWHETPGSGIGIEGRGPHRVYVRRKED